MPARRTNSIVVGCHYHNSLGRNCEATTYNITGWSAKETQHSSQFLLSGSSLIWIPVKCLAMFAEFRNCLTESAVLLPEVALLLSEVALLLPEVAVLLPEVSNV